MKYEFLVTPLQEAEDALNYALEIMLTQLFKAIERHLPYLWKNLGIPRKEVRL